MLRKRMFKAVTILVLVTLVTIVGGATPVSPAWAVNESRATRLQYDQGEDAGDKRTLDERFAEVARQVPDFGGLFYDAHGQPTMYLTESKGDTPARAKAAIAAALRDDDRLAAADDIRVIPGQYKFRQLKGWYDRMTFDVLGVPGVIFTDIDEGTNRLRIGVEKQAGQGMIEAKLAKLGIPHEAVIIEETEPIQLATATLSSRIRPLEGGLEIRFLRNGTTFICTLGFGAIRSGVRGFVTNSHCSATRGAPDGTIYHQAAILADNSNRVGSETVDPPYLPGGACPVARVCRYSDSAFVRVPYPSGPTTLSTVGYIARTTGLGSTVIDDARPRFRIASESSSVLLGMLLSKIGRTTGWSQGVVTGTCVNANVSGTIFTMLCQGVVYAPSAAGDSGSPVFQITNSPASGDVRLHGILWGGNSNSFFFSPLGSSNTQRATEMGPLTTCAAVFGC
jgi:hypothetical protein